MKLRPGQSKSGRTDGRTNAQAVTPNKKCDSYIELTASELDKYNYDAVLTNSHTYIYEAFELGVNAVHHM